MGHTLIIGGTGVGKSEYIKATLPKEPFCFLDIHGVTAREIADAMPCIFVRAAELSHVVSINPLQNVHPDERWRITARCAAIFSDIWELGFDTPRLLYYLRGAIRLLLDTNGSTLMDIRRVLTDENYRSRLLSRSSDLQTRQTWMEYSAKKDQQQANEIASLQNKVAALADPLPLRYMLGQPTSTLNIEHILNNGQNLVVDLSDMEREPASLIGAFFINAFKQAAENTRNTRDYHLIVDEFQNFGTSVISTILSESRKWHIHLTLAHQFTSQLHDEIRDAVLANCQTIVCFRLGAKDAPLVAAAIDAHPQDLIDLPVGRARIRTLLNGVPTEALFTATRIANLPTGFLEKNINHTRERYMRERKQADALIKRNHERIEHLHSRRAVKHRDRARKRMW